MSSGIWVTVGDPDTDVWLPDQEARCEVVDGVIEATVSWYGPRPGHYRLARVRGRSWRREFGVTVDPVPPGPDAAGTTLSFVITLDWPDIEAPA